MIEYTSEINVMRINVVINMLLLIAENWLVSMEGLFHPTVFQVSYREKVNLPFSNWPLSFIF